MIAFITPLIANLLLILWGVGLTVLWLATRRSPQVRKTGIILLIILWLLGTRPVAESALGILESQYQPPAIEQLKESGVSQVVVLTGGGFPLHRQLLSSGFPQASLYRFISGLELASRLGPNSVIIFSGTAGRGKAGLKTSEMMRQLALIIKPAMRVFSETHSCSTVEHPEAIKPYVHGPFVLVTSAYHMPRVMRTFARQGLNPIPYPVDFLALGGYDWNDWIPSFESFWKMNVAFREYLALALYWFKGW